MAYPILAASNSWYKGSTARSAITQINIVDSYTPTGSESESWAADVDSTGSIMCYITGTVLTIAGNGSGKIAMNADSSYAFSHSTAASAFINTTAINGLDVLDTSGVTTMQNAFRNMTSMSSLDLNSWNVSNVQNMQGIFSASSPSSAMNLTSVSINQWNTSSCTNMAAMFQHCRTLRTVDISNFITDNVTTMQNMFYGMVRVTKLDVSSFNTASCTNMKSMFGNCLILKELDLSSFDTRNVTAMGKMFMSTWWLQRITLGENFAFVGTDGYLLAQQNEHILGATGKWYRVPDWAEYDPANIPANTAATYCAVRPTSEPILAEGDTWFTQGGASVLRSSITEIEVKDWYYPQGINNEDYIAWDASAAQDLSVCAAVEGTKLTIYGNESGAVIMNPNSSYAFSDSGNSDYFTNMTKVVGANVLDTSRVTDMSFLFRDAKRMTDIDVSSWDLSDVTTLRATFAYCTSLKTLDVSNWDTSKVESFKATFSGHQNLGDMNIEYLDVSNWDTSAATNMGSMFYGCAKLTTIPLDNWDVSKVTTFYHTFCDCYGLQNLNLSEWDTSAVTQFNSMFNDCRSLTSLDLSSLNTNECLDYNQMFDGCTSLREIIGIERWNTTKGQYFYQMFADCSSLENLDLSGFNIQNALTMGEMFYGCESIRELDLSGFNASLLSPDYSTNSCGTELMFYGMNKLEKITLGVNFSFTGDGTREYVLPTPSHDYIVGADGNWYDSNYNPYTPANVPSNVAMVYYASPYLVAADDDTLVLIKTSTLAKAAIAIRKKSGKTDPLYPRQFAEEILALT